jgi:hypothetical protein
MNLLWELWDHSSPLSPVLWEPGSRTVRVVTLEFTFFTPFSPKMGSLQTHAKMSAVCVIMTQNEF